MIWAAIWVVVILKSIKWVEMRPLQEEDTLLYHIWSWLGLIYLQFGDLI